MVRIGLLSDTHHYLHPDLPRLFKDCDEIWHAGDIGTLATIQAIEAIKPVRAVYGNADGQDLRKVFPLEAVFWVEGVKVLLLHIGGYPPRYNPHARALIALHQPRLVIAGHSHILKVMFDPAQQCLYMNPGACGKQGFHVKKTILRFSIDKEEIKDLEVVELND